MKVQYLGPDDVVVIDGTELRQDAMPPSSASSRSTG